MVPVPSPVVLPPWLILDPELIRWLQEDIGRGDMTTQALAADLSGKSTHAQFKLKQPGCIAGLPLAARIFELLEPQTCWTPLVTEGDSLTAGTVIAQLTGPSAALLTGERVALNLLMHLSGIATLTHQYAALIADLPTQLVDTRKTTPGLRLLEKYATCIGGARNHRLGLDDAVMIKDNHIQAAGGLEHAIKRIRDRTPYPLAIEVETETLTQVQTALQHRVEIIMLDNMSLRQMQQAVSLIRQTNPSIKIEASGNITLERLRAVAETGVDYISTSAPITQATWLDISLQFLE